MDNNQAQEEMSKSASGERKSDKAPIADLFKDIERDEETCCGNAYLMLQIFTLCFIFISLFCTTCLYFLQNKMIYKNNVPNKSGMDTSTFEKYEKLKF